MVYTTKQVLLTVIAEPLIMIICIFLVAGRLDYWPGILYVALAMGVRFTAIITIRKDKALASERLNPGKGRKSWDKIYWRLSTALFFVTIFLACLDSGRFIWSPGLPFTVYIAVAGIYLIGNGLFLWARATNRFFSSVVRIQTDRGHTVCQEGPYKYVRHPGYLGTLLFTAVTPFLLGSLWALIPMAINLGLLLVRTSLEDKTLASELPGYPEYKEKVTYKILPHIW